MPVRYTVYADLEITRRKRFHTIHDGAEDPVFRSRLFGEIMEWLDREGVTSYLVITEQGSWMVQTAAPPTEKEPPPWPA